MAIIELAKLDLTHATQGWGETRPGLSTNGNPPRIAGQEYPDGFGTHAHGELMIHLGGAAARLRALVGIDDETEGKGTAVVEILADGASVYTSPAFQAGQPPMGIDVAIPPCQHLALVTHDAGDGMDMDHVDWANAVLELPDEAAPHVRTVPIVQPVPQIARTDRHRAGIHGPRVVGCSPGRPFLFRIPATGQKPLTFSVAAALPKALVLDHERGILSGVVEAEGEYTLHLAVEDSAGNRVTRELRIVCRRGALALTPPMGWNSWNCWGKELDEAKVRAAAVALHEGGLADFGFAYINLDDGWQDVRAPDGTIQAHAGFGDMTVLTADIHALGFKAGIYSSPGPSTCADFVGSYRHEQQDAETWAAWGFDYVKYDYCSYFKVKPDDEIESQILPYQLLGGILPNLSRDIVYSICTGYAFDASRWGRSVNGQLWRTTEDITDTWGSVLGIGFRHDAIAGRQSPGAWNDPDMLVVGRLGWGPHLRNTRLTPNEQRTHISLWALLGAPLLLGCDLTQLDTFTFDLLTNTEIIDIDQDPLGLQATTVYQSGAFRVLAKRLYDGRIAMGLFNLGPFEIEGVMRFADVGLPPEAHLRDPWIRENLGLFRDACAVTLPPHGCEVVVAGPEQG